MKDLMKKVTVYGEWQLNDQRRAEHPASIKPGDIVDVMGGDGDSRRGRADQFNWGWVNEEHIRITQWCLVDPSENLIADELMCFIGVTKRQITDTEAKTVELKAALASAMNELNRRLMKEGVTLNEVMKPSGPTIRSSN